MALINCPDCGETVSPSAEACPKCARPKPALSAEALAKHETQTTKASVKLPKTKYFVAVLAILGLVVLGVQFFPTGQKDQKAPAKKSPLQVVSTSSTKPIIGAPTVTAIVHNSGPPTGISVWVQGNGSMGASCFGKGLAGYNQTVKVQVSCPHLYTFSSTFSVTASTVK